MKNSGKISRQQSGFSMVEVLVTLIILLVGLLGLAGLMVQGQRSEMESYQRVQGLILLRDMVGRINANRNVAACYRISVPATSGPYLGVSATATTPTCAIGTTAQQTQVAQDIAAWDAVLKGAAETSGGTNIGAMVGARGCVSYSSGTELTDPTTGAILPGTGIYTVAVAWQGLGSTFANTTTLCAQNQYGNEAQRRVVIQTFRLASLL